MSTFQLARDLVEWSKSFSNEERAGFHFTYDDILPVAGAHRKLLLHALENVKPRSKASGRPSQLCEEKPNVLSESEKQNMVLEKLTSHKDEILLQLQLLDAQISDCEDRHTEEELRADQFYSLLDDQSNLTQFVHSLMTKVTCYCQAPPLVDTLDKVTQEFASCATAAATSEVLITSIQNKISEVNGISQTSSSPSSVSAQDTVIESYLSLLSEIENTVLSRKANLSINSETADCVEETLSNTQLLERLDMQASEKASLLQCIRHEEAEVSRLKEQIPIFDGTGACDDMQTAIKGLILTTETLRQETTLKSERNASLEAQLNMDLRDMRQQISSLISSLKTTMQSCAHLPADWKSRSEMLRLAPAWRLNLVQDEPLPPISHLAQESTTTAGNENNESVSVGHSCGLEHLVSGAKKREDVYYRDSIRKKSQDCRSQFRSITAAAGICNSALLSDTLQCLSVTQTLGSCELSQHSTTNILRNSFIDQLLSEVRALSDEFFKIEFSWTYSEPDSSCSQPDTAVALLQKALKKRDESIRISKAKSIALDEKYKQLSATENSLAWALKDRHESYTASPCLVEVLNQSLSLSQCSNDRNSVEGRMGASGAGHSCGRLTSMSLKDVINDFRETIGAPLLD